MSRTTCKRILLLLLALSLLVGASGEATAKPDTTDCTNQAANHVLTIPPEPAVEHVENSPRIECNSGKKKPRYRRQTNSYPYRIPGWCHGDSGVEASTGRSSGR